MSSTYTVNKGIMPSIECLKTWIFLSYQALRDCLRPYNDFWSIHTLFFVLDDSSHGGIYIYTYTSSSPLKNVFFLYLIDIVFIPNVQPKAK